MTLLRLLASLVGFLVSSGHADGLDHRVTLVVHARLDARCQRHALLRLQVLKVVVDLRLSPQDLSCLHILGCERNCLLKIWKTLSEGTRNSYQARMS